MARFFCRREFEGSKAASLSAIAASSLLFVGAVSVKSYTLAGLPLAALYLLYVSFPGWHSAPSAKIAALGRPILLSVPVLAALFLWMVHTYTLTGHWDSRKREIESMTVRSSDDRLFPPRGLRRSVRKPMRRKGCIFLALALRASKIPAAGRTRTRRE